ncbi:MAG: DUF6045 family protein [Clostridia bacterium]
MIDMFFGGVMDQMIDWAYVQSVAMFSTFFSMISYMSVELFQLDWIKAIVLFFQYLGWAFYLVGLIVSVFETAIECQSGRGSIKDTALNAIKGFLAVSLFTILPIELYTLAVKLQATITIGITGMGQGYEELIDGIMTEFGETSVDGLASNLASQYMITNALFMLIGLIMFIYAVVKVFFANLKRGGILLTQICVGSLYIFSIPRGYMDGFTSWFKKIIALCITTFLQTTILTIGMLVLRENMILGIGLMLSAGEVPRIAEVYGLDTSTRSNMMGAVHATQTIATTVKTIASVAK